jgi:hypothetical protein
MSFRSLQDYIQARITAEKPINWRTLINYQRRKYLRYQNETTGAAVRRTEKLALKKAYGTESAPLVSVIRRVLVQDPLIMENIAQGLIEMYEADYQYLLGQQAPEDATYPPRDTIGFCELYDILGTKDAMDLLDLRWRVTAWLRGYEKELFHFCCVAQDQEPAILLRVATRLLGTTLTVTPQDPLPAKQLLDLWIQETPRS